MAAMQSPTSPQPSGTTFTRSNPLQNRVTSILSASYADLDIRDALAVLDERHIQNTVETRRNLRLDIQQELVECNGEIVQDFGTVAEQLKRIGAAIENLNTSCAEMRKHVVAASRDTSPVINEARTILSAKQQIEKKQALLNAFNAHFVISDRDLTVLTSTAEVVDDEFFRVLTSVKTIHHDSQLLLGSEDQQLGLEILEQSSRQLNAAFQKLYRWIQREFKSLDLEDMQISGAIRRALRVLAERPTLFQNCLDFFAEAREQVLSNNFYAALTGAPVDASHPVMGKAIELSAHDPLRYVSDMLAWAHSATVSEREALEVLFIADGDEIAKSIQAGIESDPLSRKGEDDEAVPFDGRQALGQLIDRDLAGVFRQFKQRTQQVLSSHNEATLAYKISNLVNFYGSIFANLLGEGTTLLEILRPISETALRSFKSLMRDQVLNLQMEFTISPDDLGAPDFLVEALDVLQVLMKSYDTSIVNQDRTQRVEGFQPILQEALDPFLAGCESVAKKLRSPKSQIFSLNCLLATKATLSKYAFADRSADLRPRIEAHGKELVTVTHEWMLRESGLDELVEMIHKVEDLSAAYKDPTSLAAAGQKLNTFLPIATEEARSFLIRLEDRLLARQIIEQAAGRLCDDFEVIHDLIVQADEQRDTQVNGDSDDLVLLRDVFPRTSDEIRVLLS